MSTTTNQANAEAIVAATNELKRRRHAVSTSGKERARDKRRAIAVCKHKCRISDKEYRELGRIRRRLAADGIAVKRAELVRAGLALLVGLDSRTLRVVVREVIVKDCK